MRARKLYENRKEDLIDDFIRIAEEEFVVKKYPDMGYFHAIDKYSILAEREIEFNSDNMEIHFEVNLEGNNLWSGTYRVSINDNMEDIFDKASEDFMDEMDAYRFIYY